MLNEEELNRELKGLIKYVKSKTVLNHLHHESIVTIIDNFYREEDDENGNTCRNWNKCNTPTRTT